MMLWAWFFLLNNHWYEKENQHEKTVHKTAIDRSRERFKKTESLTDKIKKTCITDIYVGMTDKTDC